MEKIGSKPAGCLGSIAGRIMNRIHNSPYKKIIDSYITRCFTSLQDPIVLDIGCGGGVAVKLFSDIHGVKKVIGIDYSEAMVSLARKTNRANIKKGKVDILNADVSDLPFENNSFDIISAFDTINFWPDHNRSVPEVIRTLKNDGVFFIINGFPKEGTRWHDFVRYKSDSEYRELLMHYGLKRVQAVLERNTIIVWGWK